MARALHSGFIRSAELFPNRPAIEVEGQILAYRELYAKAVSIAATLQDRAPVVEPPLTAVFAYRSVTSFVGVLAAMFRGHGYVPLNPTFPSDRTRTMLLRSGCSTIVVDRESTKQLDEIFQGITQPMLVVMPDAVEVAEFSCKWPRHTFLGARNLASSGVWQPTTAPPNSIAYLLFTSGSTGIPKGVMVSHSSVTHFVDFMV